ncbi:MAG: hypothetical protein VZT48_12925 [Bulleidia sp.]|nr:hypothetical protein [Bulleidia sp.]
MTQSTTPYDDAWKTVSDPEMSCLLIPLTNLLFQRHDILPVRITAMDRELNTLDGEDSMRRTMDRSFRIGMDSQPIFIECMVRCDHTMLHRTLEYLLMDAVKTGEVTEDRMTTTLTLRSFKN